MLKRVLSYMEKSLCISFLLKCTCRTHIFKKILLLFNYSCMPFLPICIFLYYNSFWFHIRCYWKSTVCWIFLSFLHFCSGPVARGSDAILLPSVFSILLIILKLRIMSPQNIWMSTFPRCVPSTLFWLRSFSDFIP